jgi:cytokinesis protein
VAIGAKQKTKQVQWDNIAYTDLSKTIWGRQANIEEGKLAEILKMDGILDQVEEDFKAYQAAKKVQALKAEQLASVLNVNTQKAIGASWNYL